MLEAFPMDADGLRIDERYAVELLKSRAIADKRPFHDMEAPPPITYDKGHRVLLIINGNEYTRETLLKAASETYANHDSHP